jgi:hypothetical protein
MLLRDSEAVRARPSSDRRSEWIGASIFLQKEKLNFFQNFLLTTRAASFKK